MTNTQVEFIQNLSNDELIILKSLFNEFDREETRSYVQFMIEYPNFYFNFFSLIDQIPIEYLPIIDINFAYVAKRASTIGKYISLTRPICIDNIGIVKEKCLESALKCFIEYIDEEIKLTKEYFPKGCTGKILLDFNLSEKKEMIQSQKKKIYDYLSSFNSPYVFSYKTDLDLYSVNQDKLIEVLARYSHYDDLSSKNIESFKRFIRK